MARSATRLESATSDELKNLSQQHLHDPHKTLHKHLTDTIHPTHKHDIYGHTVCDFPYTSSNHGADFEPGIAVATATATAARPHGTTDNGWTEKHKHQTVSDQFQIPSLALSDHPALRSSVRASTNICHSQPLQQHVTYWDGDHDGIIWPQDIYFGCRKWGWNPLLCLIAMLVIAPAMSYPSQSSWIPDPFLRIHVARIHKDKHGSDTGTYDNKGRFRPQNFEEIFANYDRNGKGGLNVGDMYFMWSGQRVLMDFFGWTAFVLEWTATYLVIWPADGVLRKEDIRKVYDGSLFQDAADKQAVKRQLAKKSKLQKNGY